jgi:hypothetical protein
MLWYHFHSSSEPESPNLGPTHRVLWYIGVSICSWDTIPITQTLWICLIWMYEVVWGRYQPQPWHNGIISTPQVNLNPKTGANFSGVMIRVPPKSLETAYQWLTHFVYVYYGCMKWSEVNISLHHDVVASFPLLKWTWTPKLGPTWLV